MKTVLIGLTCSCLVSALVPVAGASSDAAIRAARQRYNAAIARGDADAVAGLLAENYLSVSSVGAQNHGRDEARATRTTKGEWCVQAEVFTAMSCEGSAIACAAPPTPT